MPTLDVGLLCLHSQGPALPHRLLHCSPFCAPSLSQSSEWQLPFKMNWDVWWGQLNVVALGQNQTVVWDKPGQSSWIACVCGVMVLICRGPTGRHESIWGWHEYALRTRGGGEEARPEPRSWLPSCLALIAPQQQPSSSLCWQWLGAVGRVQFMLCSCSLSCAHAHTHKQCTKTNTQLHTYTQFLSDLPHSHTTYPRWTSFV